MPEPQILRAGEGLFKLANLARSLCLNLLREQKRNKAWIGFTLQCNNWVLEESQEKRCAEARQSH